MTTVAVDPTPLAPGPAHGRVPWPLVAALAAVVARLPFITRPLSPDEGGFLLVASQWRPGTSLYGDYWVDRPPLLITLFQLAGVGGAAGLRVLGAVATVASVLLAARLCGLAAPGRSQAPVAGAATTALLLGSPLLGSYQVSGELLALPFVLGCAVAALEAGREDSLRATLRWWLVAGAAAVAAAAVKQNFVDGLLVVVVCVGFTVRDDGLRRAGAAAVAALTGAAGALALLLAWAALHGTGPAGLWDAVVTFRAEASAVIAANAPADVGSRARRLVDDWLGSGIPAILVLSLAPGRRRRWADSPVRLTVLAAVLLVWELVGVAAGGSYWRHYLIGTVPATLVAVALVHAAKPARVRALWAVLAAAAVVTAGAIAGQLETGSHQEDEVAVEHYLSTHAAPGDTGMVAYGNADILYAAGLSSPYPQLWSLPVRVRDPRLGQLTAVLQGPSAPTWVVTGQNGLVGWGIDATTAEPVLTRRYRPATVAGDLVVYHRR